MDATYKAIGVDPSDTEFHLGNCLTIRKSSELMNTPGMYAKIRGLGDGLDEFPRFDPPARILQ